MLLSDLTPQLEDTLLDDRSNVPMNSLHLNRSHQKPQKVRFIEPTPNDFAVILAKLMQCELSMHISMTGLHLSHAAFAVAVSSSYLSLQIYGRSHFLLF